MAERHAAEQQVFFRKIEIGRHGFVPMGPCLDAAGVESFATGKQHHGLDEHAEVRPLRRPHGAIHRKEQPDRCPEELEVACVLPITRRTILPRNPYGPVELRADFAAPGVIGLFERIWIDRIFGPLPAWICGRVWTNAGLEVFKRRAGECMDPPRLQIATGRRPRRTVEDVAYRCERHRGRQKCAAAEPGGYGITDMHSALQPIDIARHPGRSVLMIRAALAVCLVIVSVHNLALAMVGGAPAADPEIVRYVVLLVGSRGNSCSGVAITRDLVLTAAHCMLTGAAYKLVLFDSTHQTQLKDVAKVARHPQFDLATFLAHRATADVAVVKLAAVLPASFAAAPLARADRAVAAGEEFIVAGYGVTVRGDGRTGGTARAATLVATGQPGTLQIRLFDPLTKGERAGLGACTADSGAPAFEVDQRHAVIGVVSWTTGPQLSEGCGGLTGITPLTRYRGWITGTAGKMGSPLTP